MDNASTILATLDGHLQRPARLVLYGRAALHLGFDNAPPEVAESKDVDAIVPLGELDDFSANEDFWNAQDATNAELKSTGLYITHLFQADQVFLRRDWEQHLVTIHRPPTRWLRLFRPATLDLILTKMMRGEDTQDMADIAFMIRHDHITPDDLERALADAVIPDIVELRDAFERAKPLVRSLATVGHGE
jgi:hypothetical protein